MPRVLLLCCIVLWDADVGNPRDNIVLHLTNIKCILCSWLLQLHNASDIIPFLKIESTDDKRIVTAVLEAVYCCILYNKFVAVDCCLFVLPFCMCLHYPLYTMMVGEDNNY